MRISTAIVITIAGVVGAAAALDGVRASNTPPPATASVPTRSTVTAAPAPSVTESASRGDAAASAIADVHTALSELPGPHRLSGELVVATAGCRLIVVRVRDGATRAAGRGCLVVSSPDHRFALTGLGATLTGQPVWAPNAPLSLLDASATILRAEPGPCADGPAVNDAGAVATCADRSGVIVPLRGALTRRQVPGVALGWGGSFLFADHGTLRTAGGRRLRVAAAGTPVGYATSADTVGVATAESTIVVVRRRAGRWVVIAQGTVPGETFVGETFTLAPDGGLAFVNAGGSGLLVDTSLTGREALRHFPEQLDTTPYLGPSQTAVAFSPDDRYVAVATADGVVIAGRAPLSARMFVPTGAAAESIVWLAAR